MSLRPVACAECGNEVLVEKRSLPHTTVQWTRPTDCCPEMAGRDSAHVPVCTRLRSSIEQAVRDGRLAVDGDEDEGADGAGDGHAFDGSGVPGVAGGPGVPERG